MDNFYDELVWDKVDIPADEADGKVHGSKLEA